MRKEEESRPMKRRRTDMPPADGFVSTVPPKPKHIPVPQFHSAFGDGSESLSSEAVVRRIFFEIFS